MLENRMPTAPRGPRHGSLRVGGSSRGGGIRKRTPGALARTDKDGDLVMDGGGTVVAKSGRGRMEGGRGRSEGGRGRPDGGRARGAGRGRGSTRGPVVTAKTQQAILRGIGSEQVNVRHSRGPTNGTIKVDGLRASKAANNTDGGMESLLGFLERKAAGLDAKSNRVIKIKKSQMVGDSVFITARIEDITEILKLDQFMFAGAILSIQTADDSQLPVKEEKKGISKSTEEIQEKLKAILSRRYDATTKLLNLSALAQDPGFLEVGIQELTFDRAAKFFKVLMTLCDSMFKTYKEKRDAVVSISLAGNGIDDVQKITDVANTFPHIKNLDISGNNLATIRSLQGWKQKFRNLENLVLNDNPIVVQEPGYGEEVMNWYPKLLILNSVTVRTLEQVFLNFFPVLIGAPDFRDVSQVGETFIRQFVSLYDSDRNALLASYYDNQSVFSLAINMSAPRNGDHLAPIPKWSSYIKFSRNLVKVTHTNTRFDRRFVGNPAIQTVWSELPATRHPDLTQPDKYIIECRPQPGLTDPSGQSVRGVDGLHITIHGEFEEQNPSVADIALRSFSRSFVLGPGAPGGIPIRVISDMMTLRAHSPLALPLPSAVSQPQIAQLEMPSQSLEMPQQQKELLANQLMEKTGMTLEYTVMCLQETGWDIEQAYAAYEANKSKLPPNAFMNGVPR